MWLCNSACIQSAFCLDPLVISTEPFGHGNKEIYLKDISVNWDSSLSQNAIMGIKNIQQLPTLQTLQKLLPNFAKTAIEKKERMC